MKQSGIWGKHRFLDCAPLHPGYCAELSRRRLSPTYAAFNKKRDPGVLRGPSLTSAQAVYGVGTQRYAVANALAVQLLKDSFSAVTSSFRLPKEPTYVGNPLPPSALLASVSTLATDVPLSAIACAAVSVNEPIVLPYGR